MSLWCPYLPVSAVYTYAEIIEPWCGYKRSICHKDIRTIYTRKNRTRTYKAQWQFASYFPLGYVHTKRYSMNSYPLYLTFHFRDRRGAALLRFLGVNRGPIWYSFRAGTKVIRNYECEHSLNVPTVICFIFIPWLILMFLLFCWQTINDTKIELYL